MINILDNMETPTIEEIISELDDLSQEKADLIRKAYVFAERAHQNQKRFSGEPYIVHPLHVAKTLAELQADPDTVIAGLLHDTMEDANISAEEIRQEFGENIAFLVEGVSKLGALKYHGMKKHAESLRKVFVAMATDIRVVIIKLADRLHNIRTLQYVPKRKRQRIALETLEIYAPLANRLGMGKLKGLLEDAAFPYVYPKEYEQVMQLRKTRGQESIQRLEKVYRKLKVKMAEEGINEVKVEYRIKYLYSLYQKLLRYDMDIDKIFDISALRVIVPEMSDCYRVLGLIHSTWRPVPGRLKDYIANPKPNGYQSIHTSIFIGDRYIAEIQIRSQEMHHEAEYGVASHIIYDESGKPQNGGELEKKLAWISDLINWQKDVSHSGHFLKALKSDFIQNRIFVFTPKGDVVELPVGATPIDFAYAIHSDIGHRAVAARVNNKFVGLSHKLVNNDLVEIETKKSGHPSYRWLSFVKTQTAKRHIRAYLQQEDKTGRKAEL